MGSNRCTFAISNAKYMYFPLDKNKKLFKNKFDLVSLTMIVLKKSIQKGS